MLLFERKKLFDSELLEMKKSELIDEDTYSKVSNASNSYYSKRVENVKFQQEIIKKINEEKHQTKSTKKQENSAERKASALLNLGVIFLFLSGLIFATTNWDDMGIMGKVIAVLFMGAILYTGSYVAEKRLSLKKTGQALWVLTTLYIPIVGITFMYSLLWNRGVDFTEPNSLMALAGISLISTSVNLLSVQKYKSMYYIWSTYFTAELTIIFLANSINADFDIFFLFSILGNLGVLYAYKLIKNEQYKVYTGQYLRMVNYALLPFALIQGNWNFSVLSITGIILYFITFIISSIIMEDRYMAIGSIAYLFFKSIGIIVSQDIHITFMVIPAVLLYGIYYKGEQIKIDTWSRNTALILSFLTFNISAFTDRVAFCVGIIGIIIFGWITYSKETSPSIGNISFKAIYEILLPVYTYIVFIGIPISLFKEMPELQVVMTFCISAIVLASLQFAIVEKLRGLQKGFSVVSVFILVLSGLLSMTHMETAILMIMAITIIEIMGKFKKFNIVLYLCTFIVGIDISLRLLNDYSQGWQVIGMVGLIAMYQIVSLLNKKEGRVITLISAIFLIVVVVLSYNSEMASLIMLLVGVGMIALTQTTDKDESVMIFALSVGLSLMIVTVNANIANNIDIITTIVVLIETIYAVCLACIGMIVHKEVKNGARFDGLTIAGVVILTLVSLVSFDSFAHIGITTIGSLLLVGANIKKLNKSITLKVFLVLRLIMTYIQVVLLLDINFGDGILIIPLLVWAVASRFWVFQGYKFGRISELATLISLNLKILGNFFALDLASSIIVITIGVIVLVLSYSKKVKLYFITSVIMIGLPLLHSTLEFWVMIPWYIYLLVIGITLLVLGSRAEKRGNSLKEFKNNFFKDWK